MKTVWLALRILNYFIAVFMMYAGVATAFMSTGSSEADRLGFLYSSRPSLVILGTIFFVSGATLFYGKVTQKSNVIGHGLWAVYVCFLFAGIINWVAWGDYRAGLPNLVAAAIVGLLYLRWKYHLFYVDGKNRPTTDD